VRATAFRDDLTGAAAFAASMAAITFLGAMAR
jgi:hypothetical protein